MFSNNPDSGRNSGEVSRAANYEPRDNSRPIAYSSAKPIPLFDWHSQPQSHTSQADKRPLAGHSAPIFAFERGEKPGRGGSVYHMSKLWVRVILMAVTLPL